VIADLHALDSGIGEARERSQEAKGDGEIEKWWLTPLAGGGVKDPEWEGPRRLNHTHLVKDHPGGWRRGDPGRRALKENGIEVAWWARPW